MSSIRFTWDEAKNQSNQRKHGISFEAAARVFSDPLHLSIRDRLENGEERWQTLGHVDGTNMVVVAHAYTSGLASRAQRRDSNHFGSTGNTKRKEDI